MAVFRSSFASHAVKRTLKLFPTCNKRRYRWVKPSVWDKGRLVHLRAFQQERACHRKRLLLRFPAGVSASFALRIICWAPGPKIPGELHGRTSDHAIRPYRDRRCADSYRVRVRSTHVWSLQGVITPLSSYYCNVALNYLLEAR
jgi:hypothetical protein